MVEEQHRLSGTAWEPFKVEGVKRSKAFRQQTNPELRRFCGPILVALAKAEPQLLNPRAMEGFVTSNRDRCVLTERCRVVFKGQDNAGTKEKNPKSAYVRIVSQVPSGPVEIRFEVLEKEFVVAIKIRKGRALDLFRKYIASGDVLATSLSNDHELSGTDWRPTAGAGGASIAVNSDGRWDSKRISVVKSFGRGTEVSGDAVAETAMRFLPLFARLSNGLWETSEKESSNTVIPPAGKATSQSSASSLVKSLTPLLRRYRNVVLEGVPGTGKTYAVKELAQHWHQLTGRELAGNGQGEYAITFHPSTSYEDFVEGLRVVRSNRKGTSTKGEADSAMDKPGQASDDGHFFYDPVAEQSEGGWGIRDGFFLRVCGEAVGSPSNDYLVLFDELNRANVPRVLGDLLTTVERDKRATFRDGTWQLDGNVQTVRLPYSGRVFFVPENVHILATLNTSDRSVAPLDAALRRRFAFHRLEPMERGKLEDLVAAKLSEMPEASRVRIADFERAIRCWEKINFVLREQIGPDAMLGHSYFFGLANAILGSDAGTPEEAIEMMWKHELLPQLIDIVVASNRAGLFSADSKAGLLSTILSDHACPFCICSFGEGLHQLPCISKVRPQYDGLQEDSGEDRDADD